MAKITEAELKKSIKAQDFDHLYLLYGDEKFLVKLYFTKLQEKIIGKTPSDFNFHSFDENTELQELATAVDTLPFAEPCNYVAISDLNIEKMTESQLKDFYTIVENLPASTTLVIGMLTALPTGKKAARWKKLIDTIGKKGTAVHLEQKTPAVLRKQLISWAAKRGNTLSPGNADRIIQYSGTSLQTLQNEMEKLCAFIPEGEITTPIIEKLVTKNLETRVFDMTNAVVNGDWDSSFSKLDLLLYQREEPITILAVLSSSYVDMYRVRTALQSGGNAMVLTNDFDYKRKEFRIKKAESALRRMSDEALDESLALLAEANAAMNSSSGDKRILLEELLGKLISIGKRR